MGLIGYGWESIFNFAKVFKMPKNALYVSDVSEMCQMKHIIESIVYKISDAFDTLTHLFFFYRTKKGYIYYGVRIRKMCQCVRSVRNKVQLIYLQHFTKINMLKKCVRREKWIIS